MENYFDAKTAREKTHLIRKDETEQILSEVFKEIEKEIEKGKYSAIYNDFLTPPVEDRLQKMGYAVTQNTDTWGGGYTVIAW